MGGMPSTTSLQSWGRAPHLCPSRRLPARPDPLTRRRAEPRPAGLVAANAAGRSSDPRQLCPLSCCEAGGALPGPGRSGGARRARSFTAPKPGNRRVGVGGLCSKRLRQKRGRSHRPEASPWRAGNALFPGAAGSDPLNLLAPQGFPGPTGPGPLLPVSEPSPLSSPTGCPPPRACRGSEAEPSGPALRRRPPPLPRSAA